mgnify:CR=1 FL=1
MNGGDAYQNTANMFSMSRRKRIDAGSRIPISSLLGFEEEEKLVRRRASEKARYVELFARTNFSFLQAGSSPEDIVRRAAELGQDAVGIVDRDGLYGIVRAHEEGTRANVRVVVGCELTMDCDEGTVSPGSVQATRKGRLGVDEPNSKATWTLLVHVETHAGYTHLCQILTESHARHPKGKARKNEEEDLPKNVHAGVLLETVCDHAEGLWCTALAGASHEALVRLKTAFGDRLSIGVHKHLDGNDAARLSAALLANQSLDIPIVLHNAVRFATAAHKPILDVLQCIREGTTLDAAGRALLPNAEARMKSSEEMLAAFPASLEWIDRAREIANACRFTMKELSYRFPSDDELLPGESADQALRRLTYEGSKTRYPNGLPSSVEAQIEKELAVILRLEVAPYFLSVRTIVEMARKRDILCQGRGSAANSAVCYCLAITAVDPARSSLLFERFLSEERREPPDIDVDFEHERREEVIQDIYARYGRDRAAMVSEIISYRGKSALKEVGKVFGFSLEQVDRLSELVSWWDGPESISPIRLREAGFDEHDVRVVAEIRSLVDLGFALEETRPFVECLRAGPPTGSRCPAAPVVHRRKLADLMIVTVTDATFDADVLKSGKTVVVDFWASWCGPCKMVAPVLEEIAGENVDKISIVKLNIDENPGVARDYQIMSIPTMAVFKDGKIVKSIVGAKPKAAILRDLEAYL